MDMRRLTRLEAQVARSSNPDRTGLRLLIMTLVLLLVGLSIYAQDPSIRVRVLLVELEARLVP